jgi:DNA-binding transcriptional LysR family regulator
VDLHGSHAARNAKRDPLPRSRQLRLDLLHTFEAAARHLSFTRAGEELALSQPAVSRQVQQLEDSVGAALFERGHRALALTEAGRIMQRAVEDSLERLRDAAARRAQHGGPPAAHRDLHAGLRVLLADPAAGALHRGPSRRGRAHLRDAGLVDLERGSVDCRGPLRAGAQGRGPLLFEEEVQPMCAPQLLRDRAGP